jgi:hypothetical protein
VHARAHFATNEAEARRHFGALWNVRLSTGTFLSARPVQATVREQVLMKVAREFPAHTGTSEIKFRSLKAGSAPADAFVQHTCRELRAAAAGIAKQTGAEDEVSDAYSALGNDKG